MFDNNTKAARALSPYQVFTILSNVLAGVVVLVLFVIFEKFISPFQRGFFCDDESIMKPYKSQTVSVALLVVIAVICILAVVSYLFVLIFFGENYFEK